MTGRGEPVRTEDSDQLSASSKKMKMADWCKDCMAAPQDTCSGSHHRLRDMDEVEKKAQDKLRAALQKAARQQARLDAVTRARVLNGPVLTAAVASVDQESMGWSVSGGVIRITLAATNRLTEEDKAAVCAALEGLKVSYEVDEAESTLAYADLRGAALGGITDKLPDCVEGQAARRGDVLIRPGGRRLEVFFRDMPSRGGPGAKVLGRVADRADDVDDEDDEDDGGLEVLEGTGCDRGDDYSVRAGWGDDCVAQSMDCFCRKGKPDTTSLSDVKFEA